MPSLASGLSFQKIKTIILVGLFPAGRVRGRQNNRALIKRGLPSMGAQGILK